MSPEAPLSLAERIARAQQIARQRGAAPAVRHVPAAPATAPAPASPQPGAASLPAKQMNRQQRVMWDIVRAAQVNGADDLTLSEIWRRWCAQTGRIERNTTVSARVSELRGAGWLLQRPTRRQCGDSGEWARPVYVPQHLLNVNPDAVAVAGAAR